mgnify:CR=1 FL=1
MKFCSIRLEIFKEIPLTVYGFTDDVPELLLAADIVVTKAGGLTAAETLIAGCNYIIYKAAAWSGNR